jgi:ribonuclease PH
VVNLDNLGERTLWIDCDVLEADGGTRTASINGAFVAAVDALNSVAKELPASVDTILTDSVAAISVGIVEDEPRLDLEYTEDRDADVDLNLVMTGSGKFIEVQGSGEEATFSRTQLEQLIELGEAGIKTVTAAQRKCLGSGWPF